ncbi:MAG TPA: 30S ribosomal protein S6 [Hyphomicrobium sp.]|jgi:small subunit ribosomal protein S6
MPLYEHTFLARQDVTQAQVEALMKEFEGVVEEGKGKVTKQEYWGLKNLAFKIKKNRKAHYAFFNIDAPPAAVTEMERRMGINADVIRFITIRVDELETEPSIQMRKQDRDERGDRGFGGPGRGGPPRGGFGGGGREGGSTFRSRPPREGGDRPPRDGDRGPRPPRDGEAPRAPRPPRDSNPGSEG